MKGKLVEFKEEEMVEISEHDIHSNVFYIKHEQLKKMVTNKRTIFFLPDLIFFCLMHTH